MKLLSVNIFHHPNRSTLFSENLTTTPPCFPFTPYQDHLETRWPCPILSPTLPASSLPHPLPCSHPLQLPPHLLRSLHQGCTIMNCHDLGLINGGGNLYADLQTHGKYSGSQLRTHPVHPPSASSFLPTSYLPSFYPVHLPTWSECRPWNPERKERIVILGLDWFRHKPL